MGVPLTLHPLIFKHAARSVQGEGRPLLGQPTASRVTGGGRGGGTLCFLHGLSPGWPGIKPRPWCEAFCWEVLGFAPGDPPWASRRCLSQVILINQSLFPKIYYPNSPYLPDILCCWRKDIKWDQLGFWCSLMIYTSYSLKALWEVLKVIRRINIRIGNQPQTLNWTESPRVALLVVEKYVLVFSGKQYVSFVQRKAIWFTVDFL